MIKIREQRYKTKPIECWQKAKELRMRHYRDIWEAKEKGKLLATAGEYSPDVIISGLGDYEFLGGEPYGATIGAGDKKFCLECIEATNNKGYPHNMCAYLRNYWGSMFLDRSPFPFGEKFIRPDFILSWHMCETHSKWYQTVAEHFGIPIFIVDVPLRAKINMPEKRESHVNYMVGQMEDAIEWLQKITKRTYDDEKLCVGVSNQLDSQSLWAQICVLNKAVPAPVELKSMFSLYTVGSLLRTRNEAPEFYRMLLDEMQDRVRNQISAIGIERIRILHDPEPTWNFLGLLRYFEKYGAVPVASPYAFVVGGAFQAGPDGAWVPGKTLKERGITIRTREQALRLLAESYIDRPGLMAWFPQNRVDDIVRVLEDWNCDAAVLHYNKGCTLSAGSPEARLALLDKGIPTLTYEANMADPTEVDEERLIKQADMFLSETLGLRKLE